MSDSAFDRVMGLVVHGFETGGVLILVVGSLAAVGSAVLARRTLSGPQAYEVARRNVGRAILLGLEFLIIADIVNTITVDATLTSALALGLIVLVRTFLSFSLEVELEGALPWRAASSGSRSGSSGSESTDRDDAQRRVRGSGG